MMCAEPGTMPTKKPSTEPRAIGMADCRHSVAVGQQLAQGWRDHLLRHRLAGGREDLAQPEQPHRHRHDADAVAQLLDVEAVAEVAAHDVDADAAEQQPGRRHQQRAHERRRRHVGEEHQAEHQQRGVFRRPEAQREVGERRRHHGQHDHAEGAGDERADRGDRTAPPRRGPSAPWRSRRCTSSPRTPRPECASGSRWWSRRTASRSRCRPA